jgi:hypothetical protein
MEVAMELKNRLEAIRKEIFKRIESAAKDANREDVTKYTVLIQEVDEQLRKIEEVERVTDSFDQKLKHGFEPVRVIRFRTESENTAVPASVAGAEARSQFLRELELQGIKLIKRDGNYTNGAGKLIGIAYASERQPDKWFLGLPDQDYHGFVLLCRRDNGSLLEFVFPRSFFSEYRDRFSNVKGQLKFNVLHRGDTYRLLIPHQKGVTIDRYLSNFKSLNE